MLNQLKISNIFLSIAIIMITGCMANEKETQGTLSASKEQSETVPNVITPSVNSNQDKNLAQGDEKSYGKFFTYPFEDNGEPMIEPAVGGVLSELNGCLIVMTGEQNYIPVFPNGITKWDEKSQSIYIRQRKISLDEEFSISGAIGEEGLVLLQQDYFEKIADPKCLQGRKIMAVW